MAGAPCDTQCKLQLFSDGQFITNTCYLYCVYEVKRKYGLIEVSEDVENVLCIDRM